MDNPELVLQSLEQFPKLISEVNYTIPMELEEYIHYVAKTGDPVFQWTLVKPLIKEKIIKVISEFYDSNPSSEIPDYPNVDKFNYESMKTTLIERMDWFKGAPFTIQRISELLINPTKEYNRVDKYMRALEKNIYVVSIREPGMPQPVEEVNAFEESFILNGNDFELKPDGEVIDNKNVDASSLLQDNIEVDVTNNAAADELPVGGDESLESVEIDVQDEASEVEPEVAEAKELNKEKHGQTRKLEESDALENEPKRFKSDEHEINENNQTDEDDLKNDNEADFEDQTTAATTEDSTPEEPSETQISSKDDSIEAEAIDEQTGDKPDVEMELEERIDNKIESFDTMNNDTSESPLGVSEEGDSMVISQESSTEEKSLGEHIDAAVSESSDMDLSDGVNPAIIETTDVPVETASAEMEADDVDEQNDSTDMQIEKEPEKVEETSEVREQMVAKTITESEVSDDIPVAESRQQEIDTETCPVKEDIDDKILEEQTSETLEALVEQVETKAEEDSSQPEPDIIENSSSPSSNVEETSSKSVAQETKTENEEVTSMTENREESVQETPQAEQLTAAQTKDDEETDELLTSDDVSSEPIVESTSEIEEAILREDEYEQIEDTGSNVDPLSSEAPEEDGVATEEIDSRPVDEKDVEAGGESASVQEEEKQVEEE